MNCRCIFALLQVSTALTLQGADLRVGIIGTDTSHVPAFTKLLNDKTSQDHIPGARVVAAYKGGSPDVESSRTRVDKFAEEIKTKYGVEIVPDIPTLLQKVDAVLIESVDGRVHLEQAKP
ncbi:MAG: gfo/Idh/MocA family oxidoreductase, partial [Bryobacteraceae bacterium]